MFKKNQEVNFFLLFVQSADIACLASDKLLEFVKDFSNVEEKVAIIKDIEHEGDHKAHTIYKELNKAFITPLEREDILELNYNIDNVIDGIEQIATSFSMFNIKSVELDAIHFAELIVKICQSVKTAFNELENFKKSKTLMDKIIEINSIEEEGDKYYKQCVKNLFSSGKDTLHITIWYEIYKLMEQCLDDCENVANTLEDVILKNS